MNLPVTFGGRGRGVPVGGFVMQAETDLSRIDLTRETPFQLGGVTVSPGTREIAGGGRRDILEPRVMQVLTALAQRRGEIVTRDELIARCWEGRAVGDDAINRCIARLRRLAAEMGGFAIETISRVGYRLTADAVLPPQALPPERDWLARVKEHRTHGLAGVLAGAVVIAIAVVFFTWRSAPQVPPAPAVRPVIAVLPFTPLSADPGTRLFGDRVASAVAETLSKMGDPMVPTAQSFQYRGTAKARAARELAAMYVIDGEVVRDGGRVRVSLHFDDTQSGTIIFSRTFEEAEARADVLPERIANYIASMSWGGDITNWNPKHTAAVLRSLDQQKRGDVFAAYETTRAMAAADPGDVGVQVNYAWRLIDLIPAFPVSRRPALIAEARRISDRLVALDPAMADAYAIRAWITPHAHWAEREAELSKALARRPNGIGILMLQAAELNDAGRFAEAEASARSVFERFPYHEASAERRIAQLLGSGQTAAALALLPQARRLWPENSTLRDLGFEAAAFQGSPADADAFLADKDVAPYLTEAQRITWAATVTALKTRKPADIARLKQLCGSPHLVWWSCIVSLAALGDRDQAFAMVAESYPDLRPQEAFAIEPGLAPARLLFIPAAAPLRADPRFADVVTRIGLLRYWQVSRHPPDFCAREPAPVCNRLK